MKEAVLLYIEPNRCYFQSEALPSALQLEIPWEIAHDGEIIDKEKFTSLLQTFLQTNNIAQASVGIILSPLMTFEKNLSELEPIDQASAAESFIDTIPFENVSIQHISLEQTKLVIATNKDIIDIYKSILSTQNCQTTLVSPASIFQRLLPQLQESLDLQLMLEKLDVIRQYSFLSNQELHSQKTKQQNQKQNPLRVIALSVVFIVLLAVLGVMIFRK